MNGRGRIIREIAAMGLILVGPAIVIIPTYQAFERVRERSPRLERALAAALDELDRKPLLCRDVSASDGITRDRLWGAHRKQDDACHEVGLAAFSVNDWAVFQAMEWVFPGTRGLAAQYEVNLGLAKATIDFEMRHPICELAEYLDGKELRDEETRSATEVAAYRARLEPFVARLPEARAALERDRPVLAAMAWGLGVIEVVGWALFLVVLRQEYRAWQGRRAARARPPA